jgi:hypothetical protein
MVVWKLICSKLAGLTGQNLTGLNLTGQRQTCQVLINFLRQPIPIAEDGHVAGVSEGEEVTNVAQPVNITLIMKHEPWWKIRFSGLHDGSLFGWIDFR